MFRWLCTVRMHRTPGAAVLDRTLLGEAEANLPAAGGELLGVRRRRCTDAAGDPFRLDLEGDATVCAIVPLAPQAPDNVRAEVADEEPNDPVAPPLAHVHEFVAQQVLVISETLAHDHQAPEGDPGGTAGHGSALPQAIAVTCLHSHRGEASDAPEPRSPAASGTGHATTQGSDPTAADTRAPSAGSRAVRSLGVTRTDPAGFR